MRLHLDKIGSVTRNLRPGASVTLTSDIRVEAGSVLAGRILGEKSTYNQLEDLHGRFTRLHSGDVILGALGHRNALQGYEGVVPDNVAVGDRVHLLNLGGVLGHCTSHNPDVGSPFEVEVLGQLLVFPDFGSRAGQPASIQMGALPAGDALPTCPVVYVAGTCMNAGKTYAACALVRRFAQAGLKVGGAKLTGVSLMRDVLAMKDYGAAAVADFTDAGVVTTDAKSATRAARSVFAALMRQGVDVIVAETGDGILGEYGVQSIFADPELRALGAAFLLCANDPVGVVGGVEELRTRYGISVDVVTGPATDNGVGVRFVAQATGLPGLNARNQPMELAEHVLTLLKERVPNFSLTMVAK
ncbi:MAG: hypothetical protein Q8O00_05485 [Holophaga sp.]|nr:hypothetical protein [Holophaga sp.]